MIVPRDRCPLGFGSWRAGYRMDQSEGPCGVGMRCALAARWKMVVCDALGKGLFGERHLVNSVFSSKRESALLQVRSGNGCFTVK